MRDYKEHIPTPQELSKTLAKMTASQKLQFDAIISMITALLVSVYQAQTTEFHERND